MRIVPIENIPVAADAPTDIFELMKVCSEMEIICRQEDGVGLSAVQVGINWKLFIVLIDKLECFINCSYKGIGDKVSSLEGCLSLKEKGKFRSFLVDRYKEIEISGQKIENGHIVEVNETISGYKAIVMQHEIDHFLGIDGLISKTGKEIFKWH